MADVKMVRKGGGFAPPKPESFGGPKKPALTAYFIWCETVRANIIAELKEKCAKEGVPFKVTDVAGIMGSKYKEISEEEKEKFRAQGEVVKAKWNEEMEAWKKTPEYQQYLQQKSATKEKGDMKKAKANVKNAGMPKKPPTAFMLYLHSRRDAITADLRAKNMYKIQEISVIGSKEWKELSAAQKAPLDEEAKVLKEQYEKDLAAFKLTDAYKAFEQQTDKIKAVKAGEKANIRKLAKAVQNIYIVRKSVNMTDELDVNSTVITPLQAREKLKSLETPSEDACGNIRIKCLAMKDKAEGFVSIREGETEFLTLQPERKPRKPKVSKKKATEVGGAEGEGEEDTNESEEEEQPQKESKKREPEANLDGEPAGKKPRAQGEEDFLMEEEA